MRFQRSSGILLHLSSLPGPCGVGDLGREAHRFLEFLRAAGQTWWQILPFGPSDDGNPYVSRSSWAGSPFFVGLDELAQAGDLTPAEAESARVPASDLVDWAQVARVRAALLPLAAQRFFRRAAPADLDRFDAFCAAERAWLDDWALFAAARARFEAAPWWEWPADAALRRPGVLAALARTLDESVRTQKYIQYRFFEQWEALRAAARAAGVRLMGDIPIYCARDSADVWARRELFQLDEAGRPRVVSGVPPDYFAADGQLWGTPVYDWKRHESEGFAWWVSRLRGALRSADVVRIDHFRAFEAYWEVPADAPTARTGRWVPGPGDAFFLAVRDALGDAPFVAEDLGVITPAVCALRDRWELPGMRVLQFAFGEGASSPHLPFHHERRSVVYTATHDNDTTAGWYEKAPETERDAFRKFTSTDGGFCHYHMMRAAYGSVADLAMAPMQDVLALGSDARMNVPGLAHGNWHWKLRPGQADGATADMLRGLGETFGRLPVVAKALETTAPKAAEAA